MGDELLVFLWHRDTDLLVVHDRAGQVSAFAFLPAQPQHGAHRHRNQEVVGFVCVPQSFGDHADTVSAVDLVAVPAGQQVGQRRVIGHRMMCPPVDHRDVSIGVAFKVAARTLVPAGLKVVARTGVRYPTNSPFRRGERRRIALPTPY